MSPVVRLEKGTSHLSATTCITLWSQQPWSYLPFVAQSPRNLEDHCCLGPGRLDSSRATRDGLEVTSEVYYLASDDAVACRMILDNDSQNSIPVASATLVIDDLSLGGTGVADWSYLRGPRKKNDMPARIRLGDRGPAV